MNIPITEKQQKELPKGTYINKFPNRRNRRLSEKLQSKTEQHNNRKGDRRVRMIGEVASKFFCFKQRIGNKLIVHYTKQR